MTSDEWDASRVCLNNIKYLDISKLWNSANYREIVLPLIAGGEESD